MSSTAPKNTGRAHFFSPQRVTSMMSIGMNLQKKRRSLAASSFKDLAQAMPVFKSCPNAEIKDPAQFLTIKVLLLSNWGDSDHISLSEMDILNSERLPITAMTKEIYPKYGNCEDLPLLMNGVMIKYPNEKKWRSEFKKDDPPAISMTFDSSDRPTFVRIWNNGEVPSESLKDFQVFIDNDLIITDSLDKSFGKVIPLSVTDSIIKTQREKAIQKRTEEFEKEDEFGVLPQKKATTIEIEALESGDSQYIGLNAVEFFDDKGVKIEVGDNAQSSSTGVEQLRSTTRLFDGDPSRVNELQMWLGMKLPNQNPIVTVKFNLPTYIGKMRIWNYNGEGGMTNWGITKCKIRVDGRVAWSGRLKKATGRIFDANLHTTDIFLLDSEHENQTKQMPSFPNHSHFLPYNMTGALE